jgi:hypothetical protein
MHSFENLIETGSTVGKNNGNITIGRDLVFTVCNNSEVPTFTEDFQNYQQTWDLQ